jgi:pimeloyl-ACP methyl ester carboxylesterase
MAFIDIKGKKVHMIDMNPEGEKTIVMIHGLFSNLSLYYYRAAAVLKKKHRVVLYDLRSHGLSERRDEGYILDIMMDDLLTLAEALKIDRMSLVGFSYGGAISLYTALRYPERVERLALIEAPLFNEFPDSDEFSDDYLEAMFVEGIENYTRSTHIYLSEKVKARVKAKHHCLFENNLLPEAFRYAEKIMETAPIEELSIPVILLYAKGSEYLATGRHLEQRISQAKLFIRRGDHNLPVQRPRWVAKKLGAFFK